MKRSILLAFTLFFITTAYAQKPDKPDAAQVLLKLKKLNFLGNVLYMAAHPDDENTRLIAYLSNETFANTGYLALTRGDGGQNLIGPEIREGLGVIRTQELLAARRIDGGKQFFSRANDFGYSKTATETLEIWDEDQVLSDAVWVFRNFRPDVVITRFPPDERAGHGHHTTSAIIAEKAFKAAADKSKYPDQLKYVDTWQTKRLYTNTGRWWNPNMTGEEEGVLTIDVGKYSPLLGKSYTEIAAISRSQHKSQGFGSSGSRGESKEFLEYIMGDEAKEDIFEGIDTSWKRVKGGEKIGEIISGAIEKYNPARPSEILSDLIKARKAISKLNDPYWKQLKLKEVDYLIKAVTGLYIEAVADDYAVTPGKEVKLSLEVINRSPIDITLEQIYYAAQNDTIVNAKLVENKDFSFSHVYTIPNEASYSQPYWLREEGTLGMYKVEEQKLRGKPENDPALQVMVTLNIEGEKINYTVPVVYKWNDPVGGELYRPFAVTPPVFMNLNEGVYIFSGDEPKTVIVDVKSVEDKLSGKLKLNVPKGWKVNPESYDLSIAKKWGEAHYKFELLPPAEQSTGDVQAVVEIEGKAYSNSLTNIDYDHIPNQMLMMPATAKVVKLDIKKRGQMVGYIQGAGDAIPAALREIGYEVWELNESDITPANLKKMDAVILGVRALNTNERISYYMNDLLEYAKNGGTLIVQYNNSYHLQTDHFAPYPLELSRDRVTEEDAEVRILKPDHQVMNYPNKISSKDFDGWVQERGLYFPNSWDSHYEAILSSNDKEEKKSPKNGGLLIAPYGKGHYIYTGYSWFRELPAGVPGAYRLFVNLVSLGSDKPSDNKVDKSN
ncbi:PIG-L family deacetylase [Fulvivirga sediminis]|uniref:PIG-L family deacetylase n=1 Tax=Fulvivirga sediminis TaxID=2803949 RepID=A0A937FBY3_9BACT|nr:PIG-L family deacetylase [Fulvivirga sediminis]MBL3658379.1 PIG-L family deacetylase [Fulvivirga sediminis]